MVAQILRWQATGKTTGVQFQRGTYISPFIIALGSPSILHRLIFTWVKRSKFESVIYIFLVPLLKSFTSVLEYALSA
jgi:hypothetical protein